MRDFHCGGLKHNTPATLQGRPEVPPEGGKRGSVLGSRERLFVATLTGGGGMDVFVDDFGREREREGTPSCRR